MSNNQSGPSLSALNQKEALQSLKDRQNNGHVDIPQTEGNVNPDYKFPEHEKHLVHAQIHEPQFNQSTGKDEGRKFVQKFDAKEFAAMEKAQAFAGKKVTVFHDPANNLDTKATTGKLSAKPGHNKPLDAWTDAELAVRFSELYPGVEIPQAREVLLTDIKDKEAFLASEGGK